jgi:hypothetical protein
MTKFLGFLGSLLLVAGLVAPAQASLLGSLLTFNGQLDTVNLQAPGLVGVIDNGGSGLGLQVGDVGFGFIASNQLTNDGGTDVTTSKAIVTVFAAQVAPGLPGTAPGVLSLVAPTNPAQSLYGLLSAAGNGFTSVFDTAGLQTDTIAMVISSVGNQSAAGLTGNAGPTTSNWLSTSFFDPSKYQFEALLDTSNGGFFDLSLNNPFAGNQSAGFHIAKHAFGAGTQFIPVDGVRLPEGFPPVTVGVDVSLEPFSFGPALNTGTPPTQGQRGWVVRGSVSTASINAVPEPMSLLAFAGLFGAAGLRRFKAKKS